MKKKTIMLILIVLFICSLCLNAAAITQAKSITPSLTFSGTKATCILSVYDTGKSIDATIELWSGNTLVATWHKTGTSRVVVSGTQSVANGQSYTLKAYGTIGGTAFTATPVTKKC